jgi:ferredoxin
VLLGIESLPEASLHEQAVLTRIGAAPNQRLGCQCLMPLPGSEILITTGYW